eukprot:2522566-Rhodomonas_salina.1
MLAACATGHLRSGYLRGHLRSGYLRGHLRSGYLGSGCARVSSRRICFLSHLTQSRHCSKPLQSRTHSPTCDPAITCRRVLPRCGLQAGQRKVIERGTLRAQFMITMRGKGGGAGGAGEKREGGGMLESLLDGDVGSKTTTDTFALPSVPLSLSPAVCLPV